MIGLTKKEIKQIKDTLNEIDVKKIILFGSRAKGTNQKASDIDLAIDGDAKKAYYLLNEESSLPYFFDVLNLSKIKNQNLLNHIKRVGKEL